MTDIKSRLQSLENVQMKLNLRKASLIEEAFKSNDPATLIKAHAMLQVEDREQSQRKSYLFDPNDFSESMGYKNRNISLSYDMIRRISYVVPVIRSIINTRIEQHVAFCEPQRDKYSTGFVIRKKRRQFEDPNIKPTRSEIKTINYITDFIVNGGARHNFEADDFDEFTRKVLNDSFSFDQMCWENIRTRRGQMYSFVAVDGSTMRLAATYDDDENKKSNDGWNKPMYLSDKPKIKGYLPSYVQLQDERPYADFYPWEMCFGIRNPTTSIYANGYGICEIETLVNTITGMLWSDEYNRRFFSQGSQPKGFVKLKSSNPAGINVGAPNSKLADFKQKWQAMMSGVTNSHKVPIIEADAEWVDLQKTNREMEFSQWYEFLIKLCCAVWRIDPAEINFPLGGSADQKPLFEGSNEARLKHSKDKGLRPSLRFYERKLNKYIVSQIDPNYELVFVGLDDIDAEKELELQTKELNNFKMIDEIRIARGEKPLGKENGGHLILNQVWYQWYMGQQQQQAQQQQEASQQYNQDDYGMSGSQNDSGYYDKDDDGTYPEQEDQNDNESNPFQKAFNDYMDKLMKSE